MENYVVNKVLVKHKRRMNLAVLESADGNKRFIDNDSQDNSWNIIKIMMKMMVGR